VKEAKVLPGEFDEDGTVEIRLRRHARRDLITRITPVGHDPNAVCPRFEHFLAQVLPDPAVRRWVQKLLGYALTGLNAEHMLAAFEGAGRNGKGTLTKLFLWLYGDYGDTIEFSSLFTEVTKRGGDATPDLAKLTGKRAVFAGEPRKGVRLDDGKVKQIIGGDPMNTRFLNREFFTLQPVFKLILSFNNRPTITDNSHGIWSRMRLVPFKVIIPDDEQDKNLLDKLKTEGPGVLNWALDGYRLWREEGLEPPAAMADATNQYRAESDGFSEFLEAATVDDPSGRLPSKELYACYLGYAAAMERKPLSQHKLGRELTERGYIPDKDGIVYRLGLRWSGKIDWEWGIGLHGA
jgi:putative DNA primase/helicase